MKKPPPFSLADLDDRAGFSYLWELGIEGEGVTVGVLDTGINRVSDLENVVVLSKDFTGETNPKDEAREHGTSIARCIHAIAPKAQIADLRVIPHSRPPDRETACSAVKFCIDHYPRCRVMNLSIYFRSEGCNREKRCVLCSAVNEAANAGIVAVAAAGNLGPRPGTLTCPGLADKAFTVSSTVTREERNGGMSHSAL
jgi:serine protease AprX